MINNTEFISEKFQLAFFYEEDLLNSSDLSSLEKFLSNLGKTFELFITAGTLAELYIENDSPITELTIHLCNDVEIKKLNMEHRDIDKVTDVLSFPMNEDLRYEDNWPMFIHDTLNLGDVFICKDVAVEQAKKFNLSFNEEFIHLAVHGFLHVIGYDHEESVEEEEVMETQEKNIIEEVSILMK
jgi:probable rRNA maturation factor